MLGKIEGRKRRGQQKMKWLDGVIDPMHVSLGKLLVMVRDRDARHVGPFRAMILRSGES